MMREAVAEDRDAIDGFLRPHTASSMFLRSNLAAHGVGGSDHPHSTRVFLWVGRDGIRGAFGLTQGGFLLVQAAEVPAIGYSRFADAIIGETVIGITGLSDQVSATLSALGLGTADYALNHEEPLCRFSLDRMAQPDPDRGNLRRPGPDAVGLLTRWFGQYCAETGLALSDDEDRRRAEAAMKPTTPVRMLHVDGTPVAMAAINARVDGHVQLGGVFVPPDLRGQGYAQRVTCALLWEARRDGAHTAILFSNNDIATRAYEAVGFRRIATFRIALLADPTIIGATA